MKFPAFLALQETALTLPLLILTPSSESKRLKLTLCFRCVGVKVLAAVLYSVVKIGFRLIKQENSKYLGEERERIQRAHVCVCVCVCVCVV